VCFREDLVVVEIEALGFKYAEAEAFALQDISLQIPAGEFLVIIGPNESGKSTLCYAIAGFIPHFFKGDLSGHIQVAGINTAKASLSDIVCKVGLAFQNPFNQISGSKFTVYEEVAFGLENLGVPRDEMPARIEHVLALTGIEDLAQRSPYALSGGQQQRVALASILVMQPDVLVLDEPTSQLDPIGTREVFQVIKDLSREGITIVMAEHKMEWIAEFADRVVMLDHGRILQAGTPAEVLSNLALQDAGVGLSRYTLAAGRAQEKGIWHKNQRLPINLLEAAAGFREILATHPDAAKDQPAS
jgi:energy-coupling factor transporter ATP-binding protein EcfA2